MIPWRRFGPPPTPSSTASGRTATVTCDPALASIGAAPRISWLADRDPAVAASTTVAGSRFSVPTNDATNGVAGKL